jgi:hypothetical protein
MSTEFHRHGIDSRIGKDRADVVNQTIDPQEQPASETGVAWEICVAVPRPLRTLERVPPAQRPAVTTQASRLVARSWVSRMALASLR